MSDIAAKLDEARALIERGWCQHEDALNAEGVAVSPRSAFAAKFCAWGAMDAVQRRGLVLSQMHDYFRQANDDGSVSVWNDMEGRTQAEVIEAFRKAADLARAEA